MCHSSLRSTFPLYLVVLDIAELHPTEVRLESNFMSSHIQFKKNTCETMLNMASMGGVFPAF